MMEIYECLQGREVDVPAGLIVDMQLSATSDARFDISSTHHAIFATEHAGTLIATVAGIMTEAAIVDATSTARASQ